MPATKNPMPLHKKLLLYKFVILFLITGLLVMSYRYWRLRQNLESQEKPIDLSDFSKNVPFYEEIMKIVNPLGYSGIPAITRGDVFLSIDFPSGTWTLHNLHRYDSNDNIILDEDRYGLCGELANYTYARIKPLLKDNFEVKYAQVAESGFFLAPRATHVVLLIHDRLTKKDYLLDPSLKRYIPVEDDQNYLFFFVSDTIIGIKEKEKDVSFQVDRGTPLRIKNNLITFLGVERSDGKLDKDNFILALKANQRYKYSGRNIFAIRKSTDHIDVFEDKWLEKEAFLPEELEQLKKIMLNWVNNL